MSDPLIGRQLGDYTIVEMLGRGGMARVYKGYDSRLDRYAAIKVIEYHLLTEANAQDYRNRFQREARAVARLRHPGIVTLYQFGEFENVYYMAMAFIEGRDLAQILREAADKGERLPQTRVLSIIREVGAALDYAHGEGVIHRDVKPSNIMITSKGSAAKPIVTAFDAPFPAFVRIRSLRSGADLRCLAGEMGSDRRRKSSAILSESKRGLHHKQKGGRTAVRPPFHLACERADQAAASKSSSLRTGPESWPFAETSRSTNSMIAIGDASEARGPVLMTRV